MSQVNEFDQEEFILFKRPPITFYLLIFFISLILTFGHQILQVFTFYLYESYLSQYDPIYDLAPIIYLRLQSIISLIYTISYTILILFLYSLTYVLTKKIFRKKYERALPIYSLPKLSVTLWTIGFIGASFLEILGISIQILYLILNGDSFNDFDNIFFPFLIRVVSLYIMIPVSPTLIILLFIALNGRMRLLKTLSLAKKYPPKQIIYFVFFATSVSSFSTFIFSLIYQSSMNSREFLREILSINLNDLSMIISILSNLVSLIIIISAYVLLYILTDNIIKKEKESNSLINFSITHTIFALWGVGTLGCLFANILSDFYFLVLFSYEEYPLNLLGENFNIFGIINLFMQSMIAPIIPILITLFQVARRIGFRSQIKYEY